MRKLLGQVVSLAGICIAIGYGHAQAAVLTAAGIAEGFTLSTFLDSVPASGACCGPLGVANTTGGIMVTNYFGDVKVFTDVDGHHWGDVPAPAASFGFANAVGLARVGGNFYMTQQAAATVVQLNADGTFNQGIVGGISSATGIIGNPANGHVFVSDCCTFNNVWDVDPVAKTKALFNTPGGTPDGMAITPDGSTLYVSLDSGSKIVGFDTGTKALVFDSGLIGGGPDGTALGFGILAGKIYANTNAGEVIEIDLATKAQTVIVTGGTRGDFIGVDETNGTLLFTQTSEILRLTPPTGGCIGNQCAVPEPSGIALTALAMLLAPLSARVRKASRC
ncbi:MAG: hypothetical protein KF778_07640 [Rhodocyclaceae bacterium]|nr:hypothetical protein [Rhodocyclaceae bacterium]MBX3668263.1 hypothetical protein [Rhodocyclaceae bacterium]